MKKVLDNNSQVAHYFANAVQDEGHGSNFFFEDGKLYSYGKHFCVARRLPGDVCAFTTRTRGHSTAKHLHKARSALSHKTLVWCNDPSESAGQNKTAMQLAVNSALASAEAPRIRQTTRDAHKAAALHLVERFNEYLAALPEEERANVAPFDVSGLEEMRAAMKREEERKSEEERKRRESAQVAAREYLADWRNDPTMRTQGMMSLPPALRLKTYGPGKNLSGLEISAPRDVIQTSHGAEIPADDARALWPVMLSVKSGERTAEEAARLVRRLGVYTLNTINADGSIVVGCHAIAWCEIERIAVALGLADEISANLF